MSVDTETRHEPSTEVETPQPSLKDATAHFAQLDAFHKAMGDAIARERAAVFTRLKQAAEDTDSKSFNVRINGEVAATMSLTEPQDKIVCTDEDTLADWLLEHFPAEVEVKTVIRPAFLKKLLEKMTSGGEEGVFLTESGEEVPGLVFKPAGEAKSFSTRWKSDDHKVMALDSLMAEVGPMLGLAALPAGSDS